MAYAHGNMTPVPQQYADGGAHQPVYPGVRIGGSELPGAFTIQVVHPNGQTINVEVGDLSRPLSAASHTSYISASGPLRERLTRPSNDHMRRRSASLASTSGMEYEALGAPGGSRRGGGGLIDRVGAMSLGGRMQGHSSPLPDLTRSDPLSDNSYDSGYRNNFSRPHSRLSNRGGGAGGSMWAPPYARPASSQSFRSNNSFNSGMRPRGKDTFYPRYDPGSKQNVGSYPVLPRERRRPFFTPVPEDPVAAIIVKNIADDCTVQDINSTFVDFGRVKCVELIERCPPTMTAYIEYETKDDADMAIQATNGVTADKFVLETAHIDPKIVYRPHKMSNDPSLRLTAENGLRTEKARPVQSSSHTDDGGRTPQPDRFTTKSPTPIAIHQRAPQQSSAAPANDSWSSRNAASGATPMHESNGYTDGTSEGDTSHSTTASSTVSSGWEQPTSDSTPATSDGWGMPTSLDGWGGTPIPKRETEGANSTSWREQAVREESSDIDLV